jgi:hypothetical protein
LRIPLLAGRAFTVREATDTLPVAIVSATMARRFWPQESAVGQRLRVASDSANPWLTVVGVVPDAKLTIDRPMQAAELYVTYPTMPWRTVYMAVRTNSDPGALVAGARGAVRAVERDVPLSDIWTMETVRRRAVWPQRFFGAVFSGFAALALLLACAGVYGVMSYGVSQRTHEVGLRLALGAQRGRVIGMILGESGRLAAVGAALGLLLAFVVSRLLADLLYGVSTFDPFVFAGVALALGAVAVVASLVPAWRASRLDPLAALRDG